MEKLIKIQNELKAPKNQFNAFGKYKYRSCEDILEALKPLLLKHECILTISDTIQEVCGLVFVNATATIKDKNLNTEIVSAQAGINPDKKGMDLSQCFGSSSSYARKYALNGLFLIDDTKDPDIKKPQEKTALNIDVIKSKITACKNSDEIKVLYNSDVRIKTDLDLIALLKLRGEELKQNA
jgi:hypothetical protein